MSCKVNLVNIALETYVGGEVFTGAITVVDVSPRACFLVDGAAVGVARVARLSISAVSSLGRRREVPRRTPGLRLPRGELTLKGKAKRGNSDGDEDE